MTTDTAPITSEQTTLALGEIHPAEDNPRKNMGDLAEMAASIKTVGLLEPIVVTQNGAGYTIVAGARRHAAAKKAGLDTVPVVVLSDLSEEQRQEAMLIENLQRSDLTALEEATAFGRLIDLGLSQKTLATRIGRSAAHVSKRLALLKLPEAARDAVDSGKITVEAGLELTRLEAHPEEITKLVKSGKRIDSWAIADAKDSIKRQARVEALKKRGIRAQLGNAPVSARRLFGDEEKTHAKEPCHLVVVQQWGETVYCTEPKVHPQPKAQAVAPRKPDKFSKHRDALAAAREARVAHARTLVANPPKDAYDFILGEVVDGDYAIPPLEDVWEETADLLALPKAEQETIDDDDPVGELRDLARKSTRDRLRVAFAMALAGSEGGVFGFNDEMKAFVRWLGEHGYSISKAEQLELDDKAPR
jgi:ParB/RepB/Spo0J family partition protein